MGFAILVLIAIQLVFFRPGDIQRPSVEAMIAEVVDARFGEEVGPDREVTVDATLDGDACSARIGERTRIRLRLSVD